MEEYMPVDLDLSGPDGTEGGPDGASQAGEPEAVEQAPAVKAPPAPNWDDEANPYRQQFTGLQGNFKQVQTERQQLAQQLAQLQEELAVQQAIAQGATDDEVKGIRKNWEDQKQVAQFMEAIGQEVARVEQIKQSLMPAARQQALAIIAKQYGVDAEDLADADNPQAAEAMAKVLQRHKKAQALEQRKTTGTDRAESGGTGQVDLSKLSPLQKIRYGIEQDKARR